MRPDMLRRALRSIAAQDFKDIEVIVGDNGVESDAGALVVEAFQSVIPNLVYCRHTHNIGGTANFMHCLARARGDYFMWLADDDELYGQDYIRSLVEMLDKNPDAATSVAKWRLMHSPTYGEVQPDRDYQSKWWMLRVFKFVWKADDDFFYGLHRTQLLRNARMVDYWPINAAIASNLTYTYIIDLVIQGRVMRSCKEDSLWVNHAYTPKDHTKETIGRSVNLSYVLKRLNVHWIYVTKVYAKGGFLPVLPLLIVSAASLCREACQIIKVYVGNRLSLGRHK
jgi:glycosyltransferase involved in cell wall biosynthesis